jgi:hypothetical protein
LYFDEETADNITYVVHIVVSAISTTLRPTVKHALDGFCNFVVGVAERVG